jgi:hypothetical protein
MSLNPEDAPTVLNHRNEEIQKEMKDCLSRFHSGRNWICNRFVELQNEKNGNDKEYCVAKVE